MKKRIGKFSVLVILGMLLGMSLLPGQVAAWPYEVITTQENGMECVLVTFEGAPDSSPIGYIPEPGMTFSSSWVSVTNGPYINEPSPTSTALWLDGYSADILFDEPICAANFCYASVVDVTLVAFDQDGNILASTWGSENYEEGSDLLTVWDPISVDVNQNVIKRIRLHGEMYRTYIDDLKVCQIVDPETAIANLIEDIESMDLNQGNVNSFLSKLENILMLLENGNDDVAINLLEALINAIEAQRGNKLNDEEADALITAAQNIIDYINNNLT